MTIGRRKRPRRLFTIENLEPRLPLTAEIVSMGLDHGANAVASPVQISDDGRYTLFESKATNLSSAATNGVNHYYRYDRVADAVELVSVSPLNGLASSSEPSSAVMSSNGSIVAFVSGGSDMSGGAGTGSSDLFVRNMNSGETQLVTARLGGTDPQDGVAISSLQVSGDGSRLVFTTNAANLVPNDNNNTHDVFVWSTVDQQLQLVSRQHEGDGSANAMSSSQWISEDGLSAIFWSMASDLTDDAPSPYYRATLATGEVQALPTMPSYSSEMFLSSDGSFVVFSSDETDVVPEGSPLTGTYFRDLATGTTQGILSDADTLVGLSKDNRRVLAVWGEGSGEGVNGYTPGGVTTWDLLLQREQRHQVETHVPFWHVAAYDGAGDKAALYLLDDNAAYIDLIDLRTGSTSRLHDPAGEEYPDHAVVMSANGSYLAIGVTTTPPHVAAIVPPRYGWSYEHVTIQQTYVLSLTQPEAYLASRAETPGEYLHTWAHSPFISADGRYVGFSATEGIEVEAPYGGLFLVDRETGERMVIAATPQGVLDSHLAQISADGGRVVFRSRAPDLVPNDTNNAYDLFVFDTQTRTVERVAVSNAGVHANDQVESFFLSADGTAVVFATRATNLIDEDDDNAMDIYRRDLVTRTTSLISIDTTGNGSGNNHSQLLGVSADGNRVLFSSPSSNLVPNDSNSQTDLFLRDVNSDQTILVSRTRDNAVGNGESRHAVISLDGRYVAFESHASNLVANDLNSTRDVFVFDVERGATELVSGTPLGGTGNGASHSPSISDDGRFIAFTTAATNLALGSNSAGTLVRDTVQRSTVELAKYHEMSSQARKFEVNGSRLDVSLSGGFAQVDLPDSDGEIQQVWSKDRQWSAYSANFGFLGQEFARSSIYVAEGIQPTAMPIYDPEPAWFEGSVSRDVDVADLDGDGDLDIFVTNDSTEGNFVLFNNHGTFVDSGQRIGNARGVYTMLGDIDGDGHIDAVVATRDGTRVYRNNGFGVFEDTLQQLGSGMHLDPALGDIDGDGDLDLFVATGEGQPDLLFLNNGSGVFTNSGQVFSELNSKSAVFADVNGDGWLDVVVGTAGVNGSPNLVYLNTGNGTLVDSGQRLGNEQTQHLESVDVDGDGDLDLYSANSRLGNEPDFVWINDGNGVFRDSGQRLGDASASHVAFADVDDDGDLDAIAVNYGTTGNRLWLNVGDGTFIDSLETFGNSNSEHGVFADVDGDGDMDFIAANISLPNTIIRNLTRTPVPPRPPQLTDDEYSVPANAVLVVGPALGLLRNDHSPTGGRLRVSHLDSPSVNLAAISGGLDGDFVYDPRAIPQAIALPLGQSLIDSFQYRVVDHGGLESQATVVVHVAGVNDAPAPGNDSLELLSDVRPLDITSILLSNDIDPDDGETDLLAIGSLLLQGTRGSVSLVNGRVWYEPGAAFDSLEFGAQATDRFQYSVVDPHGATSQATVTIAVEGASKVPGDLSRNGVLDAEDINLMCGAIRSGSVNPVFDLNGSGSVSLADFDFLIRELFGTVEGDSNLDGVFNSRDLILVFQRGEYEDGMRGNSTWSSGDWNCDQEFDSADIVRAFQAGGYVPAATPVARSAPRINGSLIAGAIGHEQLAALGQRTHSRTHPTEDRTEPATRARRPLLDAVTVDSLFRTVTESDGATSDGATHH